MGENYFFLLVFLPFLGLHLQHMEVPRLGVESERQLQAYATARNTRSKLHLQRNLCHILRQQQLLNPLSEARDQTRILMDTMSGS